MAETPTPTPHDIALTLADILGPDISPRDVVVEFSARRGSTSRHRHRFVGGPALTIAAALHARLYGLPADSPPLPTALDELFQEMHTQGRDLDYRQILTQLTEQLGSAAEIITWIVHVHAQTLPRDVFDWLRAAAGSAQQIAEGLDRVAPAAAPARSSTPVPAPSPPPAPPHGIRR